MRSVAFAALSAAVALSACSERRETPTEPNAALASAKKEATGSCFSPFPLGVASLPDGADLRVLVGDMFAGSPNANAANAKLQSIASQCDKGKIGNARHEASTFVQWMIKKYGQGATPDATSLQLSGLITDVFIAVGGQGGGIDLGSDGASGIYDEDSNEDFLLQNANKSAAIKIRAHCLPTSLITIIRLPDSPQLTNTGGRPQFPPFHDINAANDEGRHTVTCGQDLLVGFCVTDAVLAQTNEPRIGHNKANDPTEEGSEEGQFEVLRDADEGEYEELDLAFCPEQANPGFGGFSLKKGGGLEGLAVSAWHKASRLADFFLPERLHATTVGGLGLGAGGRSISPFGVVDDCSEGCEGS